MWQAFELIHKSFKDGAELYLEGTLFRRICDPLHPLRRGYPIDFVHIYRESILTGLKICFRHWTILCRTVLR